MSSTGGFEGLDGVQSGMATKKIIDGLVSTRQQRVDVLAAKQVDLESRVGVYTKIQSLVSDLKNVASGLAMSTSLGQLAAISSDSHSVEGFVTGSAQQGTFKVKVESVASASRHYSDHVASATQRGILTESALQIQVGAQTRAAITIDKDTSLQDVRDQINSARLGVNAAIVHSEKGFTLVLTGLRPGAANDVKITETAFDSGDGAGGQLLNLNNHVASRAKDTVLRVDGQDTVFRSATQTVEGAIPGVSLKVARGAENQGEIDLQLEVNPDSIKAQLEQFVEAYNRLMRLLYETSKKKPAPPDPRNPQSAGQQEDPDDFYNFNLDGTQTPSDRKVVNPDRYKLSGDKSIARLVEGLERLMNDPVSNITSGPRAPAHVGMVGARDETGRLRKDGTITIDDEKLRRAVLGDYEGVLQVFTADPIRGTNGVFGRAKAVLEDFSYNPTTRSGPLDSSAENMRYEISRTRKEIESRQESVNAYRKVLTAQFVEMEKFMAKHKSQGDYLNAIASAVSKR